MEISFLTQYIFGFVCVLLFAWVAQLSGFIDGHDPEISILIALSIIPYVNTATALTILIFSGLALVVFIIFTLFSLPSIIMKKWS